MKLAIVILPDDATTLGDAIGVVDLARGSVEELLTMRPADFQMRYVVPALYAVRGFVEQRQMKVEVPK